MPMCRECDEEVATECVRVLVSLVRVLPPCATVIMTHERNCGVSSAVDAVRFRSCSGAKKINALIMPYHSRCGFMVI